MIALRRFLAWLLILLLPLPVWAGAGHCNGVPAHTEHAAAAPAPHLTHHDGGAAAHSHHGTEADSAQAQLSPDHGTPNDAGQVSPCCGAVLPAPTFGTARPLSASAYADLPAADFASADPTPLRRPPRHTLA